MKLTKEAKELRKLWSSYWQSRVLLTANNFGVFDHLKSPKTSAEITKVLKTDKRATEILLDALTGIGLLKKSRDKYKNSGISNKFLTKDSPSQSGHR